MAANDEHYNTTKVNDKPTADVQNDREVQENNVNEVIHFKRHKKIVVFSCFY